MTSTFARRAGLRLPGFLFLFGLMLVPALPTRAQFGSPGIDSDPTSGMRQGRNTIIGKVLYPSGNQIDRRVTVRLSSVAVPEFSTMTDENGVFTFRRLKEGTYSLVVEGGADYLPANESVEFYDNTGRTQTVQIQLRVKTNPVTKAAVIDAGLAGVPHDAADLYHQGMASVAAGDNAKAIEQFKGAVAKYPQFVQALNELSAAYLNIGDLAKAGEAIATALKYQPNSPTLRLNYGYILLLQQRLSDSERELRIAVRLKDSSVTAHLYLGQVLIRLGTDPSEAALRSARLGEAEKELTRALVLGRNSVPMAYRYLAALYSEQGAPVKAIEALEKYLRLSPKAKDAYRFLGDLYVAQGETVKAIETLEKYLTLAPNASDAEKVRAIITQLKEPSTTKKQ